MADQLDLSNQKVEEQALHIKNLENEIAGNGELMTTIAIDLKDYVKAKDKNHLEDNDVKIIKYIARTLSVD